MPEVNRSSSGRRSRLVVVAAYALIGTAWIALSDRAIELVVPPAQLPLVATLKGALFVAITGGLLWLMLWLRDRRVAHHGDALARSEERYRMLAERMQDVVYRVGLAPELTFEYVSPSVTAMTGYSAEEFYADPGVAIAMIVEEDRRRLFGSGPADGPVMIRWRCRDGTVLSTEHLLTTIRDHDGTPIAIEGVARDVTARVIAEEHRRLLTQAIETTPVGVGVMAGPTRGFEMTYVNPALSATLGIPAERLVGRSAFALAENGGLALTEALSGRLAGGQPFEIPMTVPRGGVMVPISVLVSPVTGDDGEVTGIVTFITDRSEAEARSRAEAQLRLVVDASPLGIVAADGRGQVNAWNPAAERILGWRADEVLGRPLPFIPDEHRPLFEATRTSAQAAATFTPTTLALVHRDGRRVRARVTLGVLGPASPGEPSGLVALIEDLSEQLAQEDSRAQLASAIDSAAEAVVITDLTGAITYVNPAFEQVSGYAREELIGRNPRLLKSGSTSRATYEDMWRRLTNGDTWRGMLVNRRRDGSLYEEEVTISPVRGSAGTVIAYVGVKRDTTLERHLAAGLSSELNDRAAVQEAMAIIEAGVSPEETAGTVCEALAAFPNVDGAILAHMPPGGDLVVPVGVSGLTVIPASVGVPLDPVLAGYIRQRAVDGPWANDHVAGPLDATALREEMEGSALVVAPIRYRGRTVGVLVAAARVASADTWIARYLRVISELATHVAPLIGPQLDERDTMASSQDQIRRIIERREFAPAFQPVCDLATRQPVGWEALTRFADGVSPSRRFADAHALGMGEALEIACGEQAIVAFAGLDRPGWLSINMSPALVLSGRVDQVVRNAGRPLVLELTEHVAIDDYARLRGAIDLLDPPAMIAIDDTGAGYASLRHVLELRPDFVKLDLGFVHAIDSDPARQAMVAGMVHYAAETNTRLIAEGIETESERRTLLRLGVRFGQGYLLGIATTGIGVQPRRGIAAEVNLRRLRAVSEASEARPPIAS